MLGLCLLVVMGTGCGPTDLSGDWVADKDRSSDLEPWRGIELTIKIDGDRVAIGRNLRAGRYGREDMVAFTAGGDTAYMTTLPFVVDRYKWSPWGENRTEVAISTFDRDSSV